MRPGALARGEHAVEVALDAAAAGAGHRLDAFTEVWAGRARAALRLRHDAGPGPLAGVPFAVKAWHRLHDPALVALLQAGAVPVGSTSVPVGTDHQTWGRGLRGPTANPWAPHLTPGGSSAGSAVAVAAGVVPFATAGDSAGSARIPAAWCGVVGVKPTGGVLPAARGAGEHAVIARDVPTAALYLQVVSGGQVGAATWPGGAGRLVWSPTAGFAPGRPDMDTARHEIARAWLAVSCAAAGLALDEAPQLDLHDPTAMWWARRRAVAAGMAWVEPGHLVRDRAVLDELCGDGTVLACPVTPGTAHGHDGPGDRMNVALTWGLNLTGHPALSLPAGTGPDGVPVGVQLVASRGADDLLLHVAARLEDAARQAPS